MTWRCSYESALRPVDSPLLNNGPYVIHQGAMPAACVHEAGHAVMLGCTGRRIACVEVGINFIDLPDGRVAACVHGQAAPITAFPGAPDRPDRPLPLLDVRAPPWSCWRAQLGKALFNVAGPAAETKYRSQAGLPRAPPQSWGTDCEYLDRESRFVWLKAGRDGAAFARLAWREACRLMDVPSVWEAVQTIEAELFSGLLHREPVDPRPGDKIEFVMPGKVAEALIAGAGIELPNILAPHQCGPECIKPSRRHSRRWEQYLASWAAEAEDAA